MHIAPKQFIHELVKENNKIINASGHKHQPVSWQRHIISPALGLAQFIFKSLEAVTKLAQCVVHGYNSRTDSVQIHQDSVTPATISKAKCFKYKYQAKDAGIEALRSLIQALPIFGISAVKKFNKYSSLAKEQKVAREAADLLHIGARIAEDNLITDSMLKKGTNKLPNDHTTLLNPFKNHKVDTICKKDARLARIMKDISGKYSEAQEAGAKRKAQLKFPEKAIQQHK